MSRKPIDKQQPTECRQAIWEWVRNHGDQPFATTDVDVNLDSSSVREYLAALHQAGYLDIISQGVRGEANIYRLAEDCGVEAPRLRKDGTPIASSGRQQMWNAMRIIKQFTPTDLAFNATTDDLRVSEVDARSYCRALHKAGYLRVAVAHKTGRKGIPDSGKLTTYLLIPAMWTGPHPPQIQRTKQIYDPNLKKVVWSKIEGGAE